MIAAVTHVPLTMLLKGGGGSCLALIRASNRTSVDSASPFMPAMQSAATDSCPLMHIQPWVRADHLLFIWDPQLLLQGHLTADKCFSKGARNCVGK